MIIRRIARTDLSNVARLVRASFTGELSQYMTQTQVGAERYWDVDLRFPDLSRDTVRYVAVADSQIVAYADWTLVRPQEGFLSNICVAENSRGNGFARLLIERFIKDHSNLMRLSLDVFVSNSGANFLYKKLGFHGEERQKWIVRSLPPAAGGLTVRDLSHSVARLDEFGFTTLNIDWNGKIDRVGLIGDKVVNCRSAEVFTDSSLLAQIRGAFPERDRALMVVNDADVIDDLAEFEIINESVRLQARVSDVMAGLGM